MAGEIQATITSPSVAFTSTEFYRAKKSDPFWALPTIFFQVHPRIHCPNISASPAYEKERQVALGLQHERAFQSLNKAITISPVLAHYSLTAETKSVDAYRPTAYGSRSLTHVEQKYGHIEKKGSAIVFGCEHFHSYLYGRSFDLETDHQPLEHICKAVERRRIRLQEYDFHVV